MPKTRLLYDLVTLIGEDTRGGRYAWGILHEEDAHVVFRFSLDQKQQARRMLQRLNTQPSEVRAS